MLPRGIRRNEAGSFRVSQERAKRTIWKGNPRVEEYNYAKVLVDGRNTKILVYRFRPGRVEKPLEIVELYR
jgi:hypothetical protein